MKPSCCLPLRGTLKAVAVIDFLTCSCAVIITGFVLVYSHLWWAEVDQWLSNPPPQLRTFLDLKRLSEDGGTLFAVLNLVAFIYAVQKLALAALLVVAAFKERRCPLRVWIVYTLIVLVGSVLFFLALISLGVAEPWAIPFYVISFLTREYSVWIAYSVLKRLQSDHDQSFLIPSTDKITYKL